MRSGVPIGLQPWATIVSIRMLPASADPDRAAADGRDRQQYR
jgi:hypothetical protein